MTAKKTTKKKAVPKKPHGRPTAYRKEHDERGYKLALLGLTDEMMAECFGVAESTLHLWKAKHASFSEAINRGKVDADSEVAASMYERAKGYSHKAVKIFMPAGAKDPVYAPYVEHYPPDTQAASLWLRNRQKALWRDVRGHEVTGEGGGPVRMITNDMSPEEAAQAYTELMSGDLE